MGKMLAGAVALVTGGGTGIGKASALVLAREGARVVAAGRRREKLEETVDLIKEAGGQALSFVSDVTQSEQVEAMVAAAIENRDRRDPPG